MIDNGLFDQCFIAHNILKELKKVFQLSRTTRDRATVSEALWAGSEDDEDDEDDVPQLPFMFLQIS